MHRTVPFPLVAALFAVFTLPQPLQAQSADVKTPNKNQSAKFKSVIVKGAGNLIGSNATASFIGGGQSNVIAANGTNAVIGGGFGNTAGNSFSSVGGGIFNRALGEEAAVGGGRFNTASAEYATVAGGWSNAALNVSDTVGGGCFNTAGGGWATVAGGWTNSAPGLVSAVGGGSNNIASGEFASVGGGVQNTASGGYSAVTGGQTNRANGLHAAVPGGFDNVASGAGSFAAGQKAQAVHNGAFVWSILDAVTSSAGPDSFTVRAPGGARFLTTYATGADPLIGVQLIPGASAWSVLSDSNAKTGVKAVDPRAVLAKVEDMPVTEWEYKHDPHRKYFGPMAQDFHAAFGLGNDDKTINTLDADGVLFLSVKGLIEEIRRRDETIQELKAKSEEIEALKVQNASIQSELRAIREQIGHFPPAP